MKVARFVVLKLRELPDSSELQIRLKIIFCPLEVA